MVHVLVTTVGHVPAATSIYVTVVIPHASDALPRLVAFSNTASLEAAVVAEYGGSVMAPTLHPSIVLVTAHAVIVGLVVSSTLIVCVQVDVFPHASPMVHVLVTTVGHVPAATSIYVTVVIPHASEAFQGSLHFQTQLRSKSLS